MTSSDDPSPDVSSEEFDDLMLDIRVYHAALEMWLKGYQQRIEDEKKQPTDLRDRERFQKHIRRHRERDWTEIKPEDGWSR